MTGSCRSIFDPYYVAGMVTKEVRSGKTGYPWIIDKDGIFLAHYEKSFVGKNQTQVREERNPKISFERINKLVEESILQGKEGIDWYISGWHREKQGEIKKLIAFTPILFTKGMVRGVLQVENPGPESLGGGSGGPGGRSVRPGAAVSD